MKKFFLGVSVLAVTATTVNAQMGTVPVTKPKSTAKPKTAVKALKPVQPAVVGLTNSTDSFSYALGMNIANNLKQQGIDKVNYPAMQKAMDDIYNGHPSSLTEEQANKTIQNKLQENAMKKTNKVKEEGAAFLAANAKRPEVKTLASGLQYEVIKKSDSAASSPTLQDTVVANYKGTLIDGTEFDNSYKRGEPITLPVGGVIKGWTEALQLMHPGDKWKLYIPSELGYGDRGAGKDIPGGATLVFDIELITVKPAKAK